MDKGDVINYLELSSSARVQAGGWILLSIILAVFGYQTSSVLVSQLALFYLVTFALNKQTSEIQEALSSSVVQGNQEGNTLEQASKNKKMQELGFKAMKKMQEKDMTPEEAMEEFKQK